MYSYQQTITTIQDLFENYSQESIFYLVFGEYPNMDKLYLSPIRKDNNPGCYFEWWNGKLFFVDWASQRTNTDSVQLVKDYYKLNTLYDTIQFITKKIGTIITKPSFVKNTTKKKKSKAIIIPIKRDWVTYDKSYWNQFMISIDQLENDNVFPVKAINLFSNEHWKRFNYFNGGSYCISIKEDIYKIYRPNEKGKGKWLTNASPNHIGGINSITYQSDLLIITKSYKDSRVFRNFGYESIWLQNEGAIPDEKVIKPIVSKYKNIIIFFDNDVAGILATEKLKDLLLKICNANVICTKSDIEYIKDISEMICFKGLDYTTNFLNENTIHNSSIMA